MNKSIHNRNSKINNNQKKTIKTERVKVVVLRKTHNTHQPVNFCQADMEDSDGSITSHQQPKTTSAGVPPVSKKPPTTRSGSTDSTTSTESSASSATVTTARNVQSATKQTTKPEVPQVSNRPRGSIELVPEKKPFQSRFLPNHQTAKKDETESSSEEETSSEESDDDEEEPPAPTTTAAVNGSRRDSIANRSSQARDSHADTKRSSRDETYNSRVGRYSSPTHARDSDDSRSAVTTPRSRASQHNDYDDHNSRYGSGSSG